MRKAHLTCIPSVHELPVGLWDGGSRVGAGTASQSSASRMLASCEGTVSLVGALEPGRPKSPHLFGGDAHGLGFLVGEIGWHCNSGFWELGAWMIQATKGTQQQGCGVGGPGANSRSVRRG